MRRLHPRFSDFTAAVLLVFTTSSRELTIPSAASREALGMARGGDAPAMHETCRKTRS